VNCLNTVIHIGNIRFDFWNHEYVISFAYICQLIGIVFFTILNFLCNKYYTFKK
jgi:putative flippase GtrA